MSIRTITAPGVQINEIDRSGYSPAMTGTKVLVMGFANKGQEYVPQEFTSTASWLNTFGEPDNEAERYFYHASKEVIDQGGVLYASRLPYDNDARGKYAGFEYSVDTASSVTSTTSTYDVLSSNSEARRIVECNWSFMEDAWHYIVDNYVTDIQLKNGLKSIDVFKTSIPDISAMNTLLNLKDKAITINALMTAIGYDIKHVVSMDEVDSASELSTYIDELRDAYNRFSNSTARTLTRKSGARDSVATPLETEWASANSLLEKLDITFDTNTLIDALLTNPLNRLSGLDTYIGDDKSYAVLSGQSIKSIYDMTNATSAYIDEFERTQTVTRNYVINLDPTRLSCFFDGNNFGMIEDLDPDADTYLTITGSQKPGLYTDVEIDEYRTAEAQPKNNQFIIIDKTRAKYHKVSEDKRKGQETELIGLMPVVTTAANALYAQSLIAIAEQNVSAYETIAEGRTIYASASIDGISKDYDSHALLSSDLVTQFNAQNPNAALGETALNMQTISKDANSFFEPIEIKDNGHLDANVMKKIGIVVYKLYLDAQNGNKINYIPVESFCGSLDRNAKNPNTGASQFIDKIVNTQSQYIECFSNCFNTSGSRKKFEAADYFVMKPSVAPILGFYEDMCKEDISLSESILKGIDRVTDKVSDINERDIDIIPDAGVANIAQYIQAVFNGGKGQYDPTSMDASAWKLTKKSDATTWMTVEQKFNNICQNVRKDCMFIADGLRPLCVIGDKKVVRETKPSTNVDADILPYVKYITGLNTNYGAGYCDWFQKLDDFSGLFFWCPPSIQACGVYIYTDLNAEYWDAPAGLNRGVIHSAVDVAFSPTPKQAGSIYDKNWNYAINYPQDGIVLEGQKTFQVKPSAFDRVNVRRLFLRLERAAYKVARYFVYEGNTAYTRQRFIDAIDPYFKEAKVGHAGSSGIYDYKIICDETNNTSEVIDRNELHVAVGIKPVKTAEFIMIDFVALRTGGSWDEML